MKIFFDNRWVGLHGIGRFASEVSSSLKFAGIINTKFIKPSNPFEPVFLTIWHIFHPRTVLFTPGFNAPFFMFWKHVAVIHDLNHLYEESNSSRLKRLYYSVVLKRYARSASLFFTVSHYSKRAIESWVGYELKNLRVVYNAPSSEFYDDSIGKISSMDYMLCVSNRRTYKNELNLLLAFYSSEASKNYKLIFTGMPSSHLSIVIRSLGLDDRVLFLGYLTNRELVMYYRGAKAILLPSLYEGFGFPIIEANAVSVPIVCSNTTSLPEVAGDSAIYFNPRNVRSISKSLDVVCTDSETVSQKTRIGADNVKRFSWISSRNYILKSFNEIFY